MYEELIKRLREDAEDGYLIYTRIGDDISQAADVRPVVRGFNLRKAYPSLFKCSQCGWGCDDTYYCDTRNFNFCPNCGARMEES